MISLPAVYSSDISAAQGKFANIGWLYILLMTTPIWRCPTGAHRKLRAQSSVLGSGVEGVTCCEPSTLDQACAFLPIVWAGFVIGELPRLDRLCSFRIRSLAWRCMTGFSTAKKERHGSRCRRIVQRLHRIGPHLIECATFGRLGRRRPLL